MDVARFYLHRVRLDKAWNKGVVYLEESRMANKHGVGFEHAPVTVESASFESLGTKRHQGMLRIFLLLVTKKFEL